jgi:hypothetical protein
MGRKRHKAREPREEKPERRNLQRLSAAVWPTGVAAAALLVFVRTLAPTVTADDSGELIAAAWHFGIPHPPGYPLWTMLCGGFVHLLQIGSVAWRANLFSAMCCAAASAVVYGAIRELPISRPVAARYWRASHIRDPSHPRIRRPSIANQKKSPPSRMPSD